MTHPGARYAGPAWLALGSPSTCSSGARSAPASCRGRRLASCPPVLTYTRVLVPMKLGPIGEEMVATAVALAKEREANVDAVYVIRVPLEYALDAPLIDLEEQAAASLAEAVLPRRGERRRASSRSASARARSARRSSSRRRAGRRPDRRSARRPAGAASPRSSRRPSTTCSGTLPARCSSSRSPGRARGRTLKA